MTDYRDIARSVLKLAAQYDARIHPGSQEALRDRVTAWAAIFTGQVWPAEAEAAVIEHYRNPGAFPLMPGDVIDYCQKQPVWSSVERARDWVMRIGAQNPYSGAIEAYSGISEPVIEIPPQIGREAHKTYLAARLSEWAAAHIDELTTAIVAKRYVPWWTQ